MRGRRTPTAAESRQVAEDARERGWSKRSFLKELFDGRLALDLVHPAPAPSPTEAARAEKFLKRLRDFARQQIDGNRVDRDGWVEDDTLRGLAELGAFGIKIPRAHGGLGLSQTTYNRALAIVAARCVSTSAFLSAHQSIGVSTPLLLFGNEAQKQKYLPRVAKGALSAFALTEKEAGSDPANLSTTAERSPSGDYYTLNGEKIWTTNGPRAEILVVMARVREPGAARNGPGKISAFIVETDWSGVETSARCRFMGMRGISNGSLRFHDVRVPAENLLWGEGKGLKLALITLNTGRLALPATCAAGAKAALEASREWAASRVQWGRPIGEHDAMAQLLAPMAAETFAMEAAVELAAGLADSGKADIRLEAATCKLWHSERHWKLLDAALQIRGGRGYETSDSLAARGENPAPVERWVRDARINRIFEGSSEIMRLFIAREAVDGHLAKTGDLADPNAALAARAKSLLRAGFHYAAWYPRLWVGRGRSVKRASFGELAPHLRFVERASRKLARTIFHAMVRFGPGLERKQAVLGRIVDIGAELFVMTACCVRAQAMIRRSPQDKTPVELAASACRLGKGRVRRSFREVFNRDDAPNYRLAGKVLEGRYAWLERL